jgi:hypothetical protein
VDPSGYARCADGAGDAPSFRKQRLGFFSVAVALLELCKGELRSGDAAGTTSESVRPEATWHRRAFRSALLIAQLNRLYPKLDRRAAREWCGFCRERLAFAGRLRSKKYEREQDA